MWWAVVVPTVRRALKPLTLVSVLLLWMLKPPMTVVSPDRPFRLVSEPLLWMLTFPPTHCSASSPPRLVSAVELMVRSPEMQVTPALSVMLC